MSRKHSTTLKIEAELKADPSIKNKVLCEKYGVSAPRVSTIRQRLGIVGKHAVGRNVYIERQNFAFVREEARKLNITEREYINAVLVDVRNGE